MWLINWQHFSKCLFHKEGRKDDLWFYSCGAMGRAWVFQTRGPMFDSRRTAVVSRRASDLKCSCATLVYKFIEKLKDDRMPVSLTLWWHFLHGNIPSGPELVHAGLTHWILNLLQKSLSIVNDLFSGISVYMYLAFLLLCMTWQRGTNVGWEASNERVQGINWAQGRKAVTRGIWMWDTPYTVRGNDGSRVGSIA